MLRAALDHLSESVVGIIIPHQRYLGTSSPPHGFSLRLVRVASLTHEAGLISPVPLFQGRVFSFEYCPRRRARDGHE